MSALVSVEITEEEAAALAAIAIAFSADNACDQLSSLALSAASRIHRAFCSHPETCRTHALIANMILAANAPAFGTN